MSKVMPLKKSILFHDDCTNTMDMLISQGVKVDAVITDPPYELNSCGRGKSDLTKRARKIKNEIDFMTQGFDYNTVFEKMLKLCKVPNLIIFCSNNQISKIMSFFESRGLSTTLLVWKKPNPSPLCNGRYVSDLEFIVYIRGKGASWNHKTAFGYKCKCKSYSAVSSKKRNHPTEKPIKLMQELVSLHTFKGGIVLDPFMGSDSTGVACQNLNRKFIGIEKDKKYFGIAAERLKEDLVDNEQ